MRRGLENLSPLRAKPLAPRNSPPVKKFDCAMDGPYRLISELHAHPGPVRSITCTGGDTVLIVTGCQSDSPNIKKWSLLGREIVDTGPSISHNHWVTALTSFPPGSLQSFPLVRRSYILIYSSYLCLQYKCYHQYICRLVG